jgi:ribonucleotide reductase small subunit
VSRYSRTAAIFPSRNSSWVFRDESAHMAFAFEVVRTIRAEEPELFDETLNGAVGEMLEEAIDCETQFAEDLLGAGVSGLSVRDVRPYLEFCPLGRPLLPAHDSAQNEHIADALKVIGA